MNQVKTKPLVWAQIPKKAELYRVFRAQTPIGYYWIFADSDSFVLCRTSDENHLRAFYRSQYETIESAKAEAEAWHRELVVKLLNELLETENH
jgi:hypothetical protein